MRKSLVLLANSLGRRRWWPGRGPHLSVLAAAVLLTSSAAAFGGLTARQGGARAAEQAARAEAHTAAIAAADAGRLERVAAQEERRAEREAQREALERRRKAREQALQVIHTRATWYGPGFHGRLTANGERFDRNAMTVASRSLPFGTRLRVVNPDTGQYALARVNDRGPFGRPDVTIDLSQGVARKIGLEQRGIGPVRVEILPPENK